MSVTCCAAFGPSCAEAQIQTHTLNTPTQLQRTLNTQTQLPTSHFSSLLLLPLHPTTKPHHHHPPTTPHTQAREQVGSARSPRFLSPSSRPSKSGQSADWTNSHTTFSHSHTAHKFKGHTQSCSSSETPSKPLPAKSSELSSTQLPPPESVAKNQCKNIASHSCGANSN